MRPEDVFMPDGYPSETYVAPRGGELERQIAEALEQKGKILSIVGASKTGKTTLCERVFGSGAVAVHGSRIREPEDAWTQAFVQSGGRVTSAFRADPIGFAVARLRQRKAPLILDDFHYVERNVQRDLARQMKSVAHQGVTLVVVNLPHRSDDPVRSNPDLSGRVYCVDVGFWSTDDLAKIGRIGFPKVGVTVEEGAIRRLAEEALTSPQIMHTLCLETSREVTARGPDRRAALRESDLPMEPILERAARSYVNESVVTRLRLGPARRGQERKLFGFVKTGQGDVYELLLRAIALSPPQLSFTYEQLRERAARLVPPERPEVLSALEQWNELFQDAEYRPLEWDGDHRTLTILDPHLYFWIRRTVEVETRTGEGIIRRPKTEIRRRPEAI